MNLCRYASPVLPAAVLLFCGCNSKTESTKTSAPGHNHEHADDHRPASYAAAVREIRELGASVAKAFSAGTPDDAHDALHDLGQLLKALPDVAGDTDLPKDDWQAVKDAGQRLFDAYDKLDQLMHGNKEKKGDAAKTLAEASPDIEAALEILESKLALTGEPPAPAKDSDPAAAEIEHDHDHDHDHEHKPSHDENEDEDEDDAQSTSSDAAG